jgi:nicotinamidase/pyrazinamidase
MTHALVVVDMQRTFVESVPAGERVLAAVNARAERCRDHAQPVLYTRDIQPDGRPPGHESFQLHPGLVVCGTIVEKGPGRAGGFSGFVRQRADAAPGAGGLSELAPRLLAAQVTELTVVGLAADVCVAATAADAALLGWRTTLDLRASAFVHAHPHGDRAAVADLRAAGVNVIE